MFDHQRGICKAQELADRNGLTWAEVRRLAADSLAEDWPEDEGMGSSDVSCHLAVMAYTGELEAAITDFLENDPIGPMAAELGLSRLQLRQQLTELLMPV